MTARRVLEPLHQVPVSVAIIEPDVRMHGAIDAATEAARSAPNLALSDNGPGRRYGLIRGIGLMGHPISPFDGTVSFALNGQPLSGDAGFSQSLDVERVEVLRGPQNILFGRSSQGGTINIVPRVADWQRERRVSGQFGSDNQYLTDVIIGNAITDRMAARAALRLSGADGYIDNVGTGNELGRNRLGAMRGSLAFDLDSRTTLTATGYVERDRMRGTTYVLRDGPHESWLDGDPDATRRLGIGGLELMREFRSFDLTASLGFQDIRQDQSAPTIDAHIYSRILGLPPSAFEGTSATDWVEGETHESAWSGEVRLSSLETSDWRWTTGLSFYTSRVDRESLQRSSLSVTGNGRHDGTIELETFSAFGELGLPITERLTFTPGLRVGRDRVNYDNRFDSLGAPDLVLAFEESDSWSDTWVTGGLGLDYRLLDDVLVYGSVKRGHSSGGFPSVNRNAGIGVPLEPYEASTSWTYEVGTRAALMNGAISVSGAAFFNDVRKGHLQSFDLLTYQTVIVPIDYETYGFEADVRTHFGDRWSLFGGLGYTQTELKNVPPEEPSGARDGNAVPGVPEWTGTAGLEHRLAVSPFGVSGELVSAVDLQYVGSRSADIQNSFDLKSYTAINARLGWQRDSTAIYAYGHNLRDKQPEMTGTEMGGVQAVTLGRGRTVGIGFSMEF
ncbi:MAG: TonB-dependent receptor [Ectothiorhodospiraceae bacterium]|nr:TonB-dependent receptor [Ectothiorhodospiraceae bacterium]